jgi:hypothetical protein
MNAWLMLLPPLLVLPVVLLFRFVGCESFKEEPLPPEPPKTPSPMPPGTEPNTKPPRYRDYILGLPGNPGQVKNPTFVPNGAEVIAYWRLVDAAGSPAATDQKGFQDGAYKEGHILPAVGDSEGRNPAHFVSGQSSLIVSDPAVQCRFFDGGYVQVPYKPGLYADQFTIEAWIKIDSLALNFSHALFDAGGRYALTGSPIRERGFRLYADQQNNWQARVGPGTADLFANPPKVSLSARTHVALTVADAAAGGGKKKVTLYLDAKEVASAIADSYAPPDNAPLYIGIENTNQSPTTAPTLRHPALFRIQEVVLYRKALAREELENHVDINR